jgi:hypothetical protein
VAGASRSSVDDDTVKPAPQRSWFAEQRPRLAEHRPFLVALALGAALRVLVEVAFAPGLVYSDGVGYLSLLKHLQPYEDRPAGYALILLIPLYALTGKIILTATIVQHLIGLATAAVLYSTLRHWSVGRWVATLATLPVLFDSLQLVLEHSLLSDSLFVLMLTVVMALLGWRRHPTPRVALVAGLLLGAAVTVRLVGEPLIVTTVAFFLLVGTGWRGKVVPAVVLVLGFAVPVGAYAVWYHAEHGVYALSQFSDKSLWLRTTTFVDCSKISVPRYQRVLCPRQPLGERLDPTYYGWHDPETIPSLFPPSGTTIYEAMGEFARTAIRAQPLDYARVVLRDFALNFDIRRVDRFEFDTAHKWTFKNYLYGLRSEGARRAYDNYGGQQLNPRQPYANAVVVYQYFGYLPGPALFGCLLIGLLGGLGVRGAGDPWMRSMSLLLTLSGVALLLVPDATAEFIWRYQLPALTLLPAGAAVAFTAMRGSLRGGNGRHR